MTLPTIDEARSWRGLMLVATGDEPVGRIDAVYVDRTTRQPEWVLVHTGLFGSSRTFVPLTDATKLGDTVRVPHDLGVVREAPRLEPDVDLSESDEARLYAHYGIDYTTAASPSGLPATESGTDATTELPRPVAAAPSTAPRLEADAVAWPERRAAGRRRPLLAGLGALALAALGSGLALLRARRRRPPSFGERLAKAGRGAADTLTSTAGSIVREAAAGGASDRARKAASGGRRAARRAAAQAAASGAAAAAGGRWAARRAGGAGRQAGRQTASEGRRFARRAGREAAEAAAGTRATVAAKRAGRRRARARKRAAAAAAGTARSLTGFPTAAGRRMQRLDLDQRGRKVREQARKAVPRRRRRSNMKVIGKLGMALGAAVGYVLGAKAGRERYEQISASARQLMEKPQVKRVMESAPGNLGARVEQVANKAADAVHQASDRVAPSDTAAKGATTDGPGGTTNAGATKRPATGSGSRERSKTD
jgi:PRC-barrel domain